MVNPFKRFMRWAFPYDFADEEPPADSPLIKSAIQYRLAQARKTNDGALPYGAMARIAEELNTSPAYVSMVNKDE